MATDRAKAWGLGLAALAVALAMGWCCKTVLDGDAAIADIPVRLSRKTFKRPLAENLTITRDGFYGIDFVKCASCRLEKRKSGALTMGGMNILVLEGLEVVVPPRGGDASAAECVAPSAAGDRGGDGACVVECLGISRDFLSSRGVPYRFSGVAIVGLSISRLISAGGGPVAILAATAASGKAVRGGMELEDCTIYGPDGDAKPVRKAKLVLEGKALRLVWRGGAVDLNAP